MNRPLPANDRQRGGRWSLSRLLGVFAPFSDIDTVGDAPMHYRLGAVHILRNTNLGSRETPPHCNIVINWQDPPPPGNIVINFDNPSM